MTEKRKPENGAGRRKYDGQCPVHDICMKQMETNSQEINWMKKLMIGTLITGFFVFGAAMLNLYVQYQVYAALK